MNPINSVHLFTLSVSAVSQLKLMLLKSTLGWVLLLEEGSRWLGCFWQHCCYVRLGLLLVSALCYVKLGLSLGSTLCQSQVRVIVGEYSVILELGRIVGEISLSFLLDGAVSVHNAHLLSHTSLLSLSAVFVVISLWRKINLSLAALQQCVSLLLYLSSLLSRQMAARSC